MEGARECHGSRARRLSRRGCMESKHIRPVLLLLLFGFLATHGKMSPGERESAAHAALRRGLARVGLQNAGSHRAFSRALRESLGQPARSAVESHQPGSAPPDLAAAARPYELDTLVVRDGSTGAARNPGGSSPIEDPQRPLVGALASGSSTGIGSSGGQAPGAGGSTGSQATDLSEPGTWVLLGSSLAGLAFVRRQRKRAA